MRYIKYTGKIPNSFRISPKFHSRLFPKEKIEAVNLLFTVGNRVAEVTDHVADFFADYDDFEIVGKDEESDVIETYKFILRKEYKNNSEKLNSIRKFAKKCNVDLWGKSLDDSISILWEKLNELRDI